MRRVLRGLHLGLVLAMTVGVLVQALLAGQFISGLSNALPVHGAVGGVLELLGLVLLLVAIANRALRGTSWSLMWASVGLAVAVEAQAALGWAPGAVPTAVHVPLGVCIFAGAIALSVAMLRAGRTAAPATGDLDPGGGRTAPRATGDMAPPAAGHARAVDGGGAP